MEEEKLRKAVNELARRELLQMGVSEKQAIELTIGTSEIGELIVKNIITNDKLEKDILEKTVEKLLLEDKTTARMRMWALVEAFFLKNGDNSLRQIEFAEKIITLAQAQIYGRNLQETIKEKMRTAEEFTKVF